MGPVTFPDLCLGSDRRTEMAMVPDIVVVRHHREEFRFRCFGAKYVAAIISNVRPTTIDEPGRR